MISGGSAVKPVNLLIWIVAALSIAFVIINWGMLVAPIQASFGFTRVIVPLAVFFGLLLTVQFRLMAMHRRHSAELRTQRELVDNAEASRFTELRQYLQQELVSLREAQRASEQRLREEILATGNTLAACVGEIDERLERQWPSAPEQQP